MLDFCVLIVGVLIGGDCFDLLLEIVVRKQLLVPISNNISQGTVANLRIIDYFLFFVVS